MPPEVTGRQGTSTALWPRFNTPPRGEYSWKGAALWRFFRSSEELSIKRFLTDKYYTGSYLAMSICLSGNGQRTNQKRSRLITTTPPKKDPTERRILVKRCRTWPSIRSSEELRIKRFWRTSTRRGIKANPTWQVSWPRISHIDGYLARPFEYNTSSRPISSVNECRISAWMKNPYRNTDSPFMCLSLC